MRLVKTLIKHENKPNQTDITKTQWHVKEQRHVPGKSTLKMA